MDSLVQEVFEIIVCSPGIDTPEVCLKTHQEISIPEQWTGPFLAAWLSKNESVAWIETCEAVDELISEGRVAFGDDGDLRATGYSS